MAPSLLLCTPLAAERDEPVASAPLQLTSVYALAGRFASTRCGEVEPSPFERLSAQLAGGHR